MNKLGINFENVLSIQGELNITVLETLKKLKLMGVSSLDVKFERLTGENSYMKEIITSGIGIGSVFSFCALYEKDNLQKALSMIDLCAEYKIKEIMLLTDILQGGYSSDQIFNLKQNLRRIVKYAENFGVTIGVENVGNHDYPIKTIEQTLDILKSVKGLHLIFDGGNYYMMGEDVVEASKLLAPYVQRYHLKDCVLFDNEYKTVAVGDGNSSCKQVFEILKEFYPNVPLVIEFPFKDTGIYNAVEKSCTYVLTEII